MQMDGLQVRLVEVQPYFYGVIVLQYNDTRNIKSLYHTVFDERTRDFVLENGIVQDDFGLVYLAEKPLDNRDGYVFKVTIPNNNQLLDWREAWYDDAGEEIDSMNHQYDEDNPYYIYSGNIAREYIELMHS